MTREDLGKVPTIPTGPSGNAGEAQEPEPLAVTGPDGQKEQAAGMVGGIVVAAGIVWAVVISAASRGTEAPQLATLPVSRGEFVESVQATGTAEPLSAVMVTPEVDGIIEPANVAPDEGACRAGRRHLRGHRHPVWLGAGTPGRQDGSRGVPALPVAPPIKAP